MGTYNEFLILPRCIFYFNTYMVWGTFSGMQILSCSGDGLLKLWTIKTSECIATFDGHDGKVWALDGNY